MNSFRMAMVRVKEITMNQSLILIIILMILALPTITKADSPPELLIFEESFSETFPPTGWTLASTNPTQTWKSVTSAFDGNLIPHNGDYFAFVQGDSSFPSDELLITYPIEIPTECLFNDDEYYFYLYFWYSDNYLAESDYFLSIEFSSNPYPDWDIFYQKQISESYGQEFNWAQYTVGIYGPQTFWIGFRFQGSDLSVNAAIALDLIEGSCERIGWDDDSGDNDALDDDTGNNDTIDDDQLDDDAADHRTSDDDHSNNGCGCSITSPNTDVSLFLAMFIIGIGAWIVGNKRK